MGKFTITHDINCNVEAFWKTFFDKDFNVKLYKDVLGFPDFQVVDQKDDDAQVIRKVAAQPKMEVPGPVAKLIGPGFRYNEEGTMKKSEGIWRWKMIPSTLADKLFTSGIVRAQAAGDKTKRIAEITIEAKVMLVGSLIESSAEKQMREGWDKSAVFMNKWIADHP